MKLKTLILSFIIPLLCVTQPANAAPPATNAIHDMVNVLITMKTKPDKEQLKNLKSIAESNAVTTNVQNMAKAMININGTLQQGDKQLVWGVLRGISTGEDEKELAKLINGFDGEATKEQKMRLRKLLPPPAKPQAKKKAAKKADKKKNAQKEKKVDKKPAKTKGQ